MISANSRYAARTIQLVAGDDGKARNVILPGSPAVLTAIVRLYTWSEGDRPDLLAYRNFGDVSQWWRIADVNPQIMDWTDIAVGTTIRIPIV
ncbi:hypothetical protein [Streptomyces sp. BH105]|uniref:hypothetical protein n=1 Tax=Streptomyces sp. BH105 TaxID=3410408 RepID=UPI003CE787B5